MTTKAVRTPSGGEIFKALGGRVRSSLYDNGVSLLARSDGRQRHFLVDHRQEGLDALLVLKYHDPVELRLSAAWPRAVIAELSFAGRRPGSHRDEAQRVAGAELFLHHPGGDRVVVVDRWDGAGNRALRAARPASVDMLGGISVAGPAPRYTITVTPVQTAIAAGMMWNWDSAELPPDDVLDFDSMLRRFPPWAKVHDPPSLDAFQSMRAKLRAVVNRLDETEARIGAKGLAPALGGHQAAGQPAYPGQIPDMPGNEDLPAPVYPGRIPAPAGGAGGAATSAVLEMLGGFVHGDALPGRTGLAFVPQTLGTVRTFSFGLLLCSGETQIEDLVGAAKSSRP